MTYLYHPLKNPTRLYIKKCPHCDLKYFGKTIKPNIERYYGSGYYWLNHLYEHKVVPIHVWNSDWYYDTSITRFAIKFSRMNRIIHSDNWANLVEENGIGGGGKSIYSSSERHKEIARYLMSLNRKPFTGPHSEKSKKLMSVSHKGKKLSEEHKEKLSKNNFSKRDPIKQKEHAIMAGKLSGVNRNRKPMLEETKEKLRILNTNKKHTEESKEKMKEAWKKSPRKKMRWIYSLELQENKMISVDESLPKNWQEGRKMLF